MAVTVQAMAASLGLAALGAGLSIAYFRPKRRLKVRPMTPPLLARARLHLHRMDLIAFVLAARGLLTLIPETVQAFAPELMEGASLVGSGLEHFDYLAFIFVSLSFGMGIARRVLLIQLEKASLQPCP